MKENRENMGQYGKVWGKKRATGTTVAKSRYQRAQSSRTHLKRRKAYWPKNKPEKAFLGEILSLVILQ